MFQHIFFLEITFPRFNRNVKWIQKHKEWAKENQAPSRLDSFLQIGNIYFSPLSSRQVSMECTKRSFSRKYPKAATQVTSVREMQAGSAGMHIIAPNTDKI